MKICLLILEKVGFGKKGDKNFLELQSIKTLNLKDIFWSYVRKLEKKLSVLGRVCHILNLERRRSLMKAFIESQFEYCPLVCIVCGRQENNRINHLHERALRIVYNDYKSAFENLLELDNWVSVHHRNIRLLSIDLYKVKHDLSYQVISELFNLRNVNYDFSFTNRFWIKTNIYNYLWFTVFKIFCSKNLEHRANWQ